MRESRQRRRPAEQVGSLPHHPHHSLSRSLLCVCVCVCARSALTAASTRFWPLNSSHCLLSCLAEWRRQTGPGRPLQLRARARSCCLFGRGGQGDGHTHTSAPFNPIGFHLCRASARLCQPRYGTRMRRPPTVRAGRPTATTAPDASSESARARRRPHTLLGPALGPAALFHEP